jgi:hypothetical protein
MNELNLVIFCKSRYKNFLPYCIYSAETFLQDKIISRTIITEKYFEYKNFNIIEDEYLWSFFDSDFKYKKLYDLDIFSRGWTKQQILKLSLDKIFSGNILVLDADLLFLSPVKFLENGKYNFYLAHEYDERYFLTNDYLLKLQKQTKKYESFITDFGIFNSDILKEIKIDIENMHKKCWMSVLDNYINVSKELPLLSEYELYGNYVLMNKKEKVNKIIKPIDYKMRINFNNYKNYSPEKLLQKIIDNNSNYYQCIDLNTNNIFEYV